MPHLDIINRLQMNQCMLFIPSWWINVLLFISTADESMYVIYSHLQFTLRRFDILARSFNTSTLIHYSANDYQVYSFWTLSSSNNEEPLFLTLSLSYEVFTFNVRINHRHTRTIHETRKSLASSRHIIDKMFSHAWRVVNFSTSSSVRIVTKLRFEVTSGLTLLFLTVEMY
jgi:hypothetical protein